MSPWPMERRQTPTAEESLALVVVQIDVLKERLGEVIEMHKELLETVQCFREELSGLRMRQREYMQQLLEHKERVSGLVELYNTATVMKRVVVWVGASLAGLVLLVSNWVTIKSWFK